MKKASFSKPWLSFNYLVAGPSVFLYQNILTVTLILSRTTPWLTLTHEIAQYFLSRQLDAWWNVTRCSHLFHLARKNGRSKVLEGDSDCATKASAFSALFVISYFCILPLMKIFIFILSHSKANLKLRDNNIWKKWQNKDGAHGWLESWSKNMMKISSAQGRGQLHRGSSGKAGFNEQENKKALGFCPVKLKKNRIYCAKVHHNSTVKLHWMVKISHSVTLSWPKW